MTALRRRTPPLLLIAVALGACTHLAEARQRVNGLQPTWYESASGHVRLRVVPDSGTGEGGAEYTLERDGATVWSGPLPFALWSAAVAEDGAVAGYAYSRGFSRSADPGDFLVVILGSDGTVLMEMRAPRKPSQTMHVPAWPIGTGVVLDEDDDRVIVRVHEEASGCHGESWWVYQLTTGAVVGNRCPSDGFDKGIRWNLLEVHPVASTPLVAVRWMSVRNRPAPQSPVLGAAVTLFDQAGCAVGRIDLPEDFMTGDRPAGKAVQARVREGQLRCERPGEIDIYSLRQRIRMTFAVRPDAAQPSGWRLETVAQTPDAEPWGSGDTPPS